MSRPSFSKVAAVLVLAAFLSMPALSAAEHRSPADRALARASEIWSLLARSWAKIGCIIDPSGRCAPEASKIGCIIDPDGRCAPAPATAEIGCGIDPSGRCGGGQ